MDEFERKYLERLEEAMLRKRFSRQAQENQEPGDSARYALRWPKPELGMPPADPYPWMLDTWGSPFSPWKPLEPKSLESPRPSPEHDFSDPYLPGVCCRCGSRRSIDGHIPPTCVQRSRDEIVMEHERWCVIAMDVPPVDKIPTKPPRTLSTWSVGNPSPVGGGCLWHMMGGPTVGKAQP